MNGERETRILLLIEDDPADVRIVSEYLADSEGDNFNVTHVPRISDALDRLTTSPVDVIVLDLGLPDCDGVESVRRLRKAVPEAPVIVLTGSSDPELALACIDAGAQDYLGKSEVSAQGLRRAIGYALSRLRKTRLREMERIVARMRELSSHNHGTTITARLAGSGAIRQRSPETFEALCSQYRGLLEPLRGEDGPRDVALPREALEAIATVLGDANAGPRDLLDVHLSALEHALEGTNENRARYLMLETRLLALQMMGMLVEYYRTGHRRLFTSEQDHDEI